MTLSTAVVKVQVNSSLVLARVLLDAGSQPTLVTRKFVAQNGLYVMPSSEPTALLRDNDGDVASKCRTLDTSVNLVLQSRFYNFQIAITFFFGTW